MTIPPLIRWDGIPRNWVDGHIMVIFILILEMRRRQFEINIEKTNRPNIFNFFKKMFVPLTSKSLLQYIYIYMHINPYIYFKKKKVCSTRPNMNDNYEGGRHL